LAFLVLPYLLIAKLYSYYYGLKFPLIFISTLICLPSLLTVIFFLGSSIKVLGYGLEANSKQLIRVNTNNKKFNNYLKLYIEKNNKIQDVFNEDFILG
jgi:hypothetical protein